MLKVIPILKNPKKILDIIGRVIKAGKKFLNIIAHGEDIKNTTPLDEEKSTAVDIMQINSLLIEYREKVSKESRELEGEIKEVCKAIFEQIVESVEFANTEFKFYRIEVLNRKLDSYLLNIDGIFERHVSKRISLDNSECVNILKMMPGELKAQRMAEMKKKVFIDTIDELCRRIEDFQHDFSEGMEMIVDDKLNSLEYTLNERMIKFNEMTDVTKKTEAKKKEITMNSKLKYSEIQLFSLIMEGEI